jgi:hypothetical protein
MATSMKPSLHLRAIRSRRSLALQKFVTTINSITRRRCFIEVGFAVYTASSIPRSDDPFTRPDRQPLCSEWVN